VTLGVELGPVELPSYDLPAEQPSVPLATYEARLRAASAAAAGAGLDALLVYADREHFANLSYLTGYDPRFEESLLILVPGRAPVLLVGNEGTAYAAVVPPSVEVVLYQSFSLVSQDRSASPRLAAVLRQAGVGEGVRRVGIGLPLSYHPVLLSGERAALGLASASGRVLRQGDPMSASLGYWGSNIARGGFLAASAGDLPVGDYVERLVAPYFACAAEWYETIGIGVTGGELFEVARRHLCDPFFGVHLNPGHFIHLDEWPSSPVYAGSSVVLASGMALQLDIIPATGTVYHTSNIEDGVALADDGLRAEIAARYPGMWQRVCARRAFMADVLGIRLRPEVLPLSNLAGYLPPLWLSPHLAMRRV